MEVLGRKKNKRKSECYLRYYILKIVIKTDEHILTGDLKPNVAPVTYL